MSKPTVVSKLKRKPVRKPKPGEQLLTVPGFAQKTGMSVPWVRKAIYCRMVDCVRIGARSVRIPESEVDRLIERNFVPRVTE